MKGLNVFILIFGLLLSYNNDVEKEIGTKNFSLIKLDDGVYACIHKFGGKAICNAGIVDNGNETIIFDSFLSPEASKELIEVTEELGLSPIKYVINSHGHNDHIRGNQSFSKDVEIISTKKTAEKIEKEEPGSMMAEKVYALPQFEHLEFEMKNYQGDTTSKEFMVMKMMKPYFEELSQSHEKIETRLPTSFVEGEKEINGKTRNVLLMELDSCHTVSDLVMYLPKEKILFTGDVVFNEFHPYLGDGNSAKLKSTLAHLEGMEIDKIIPGHGNVGGKELLSIMIDYVEDLETVVEKALEKNESLAEVKRLKMLSKYENWWLGNFYATNLEYLYKKKVDE